jgi:CheY-like chemotaxis protein
MCRSFPEIDEIKNHIRETMRPPKPKMLVVDDEPDNLDLLYRTFRREFQVYKAISGADALKVLEDEGEVAVIISDQRMPEMKGTEFLRRTVPQFPNTIRIILTGFTDIEDLVEAINSGQVYKYITKPWDPNELRGVVDRAADTYLVLQQRTEELARSRAQVAAWSGIVEAASNCTSIPEFLDKTAHELGLSSDGLSCAVCHVKDGAIAEVATSPDASLDSSAIASDPLVVQALGEGVAQMTADIARDAARADLQESYKAAGLVAHAVVPAMFRDRLIGLLSLQWKSAQKHDETEVDAFGLYARQIALALSCFEEGV